MLVFADEMQFDRLSRKNGNRCKLIVRAADFLQALQH